MVVKITETEAGIEMSVTKLGQKGYIAKITGPHHKYKMSREFLLKEKIQTIDYGLYEIREGAKGQKQYYNVIPPTFVIAGLQKVFVEEITYNAAVGLAQDMTDDAGRGINVSGKFHERTSHRGPRLQGDYPDRQIPGNPDARYDY